MLARRAPLEDEAGTMAHAHERLHEQLARDHLLSLMDAKLAWIERALRRLRAEGGDAVPETSVACREWMRRDALS